MYKSNFEFTMLFLGLLLGERCADFRSRNRQKPAKSTSNNKSKKLNKGEFHWHLRNFKQFKTDNKFMMTFSEFYKVSQVLQSCMRYCYILVYNQ